MKKQAIITILVVIIVIVIAVVGYMHYKNTEVPAETQTTTPSTSITITEDHINEANYTGTKPTITGSGALADATRKYISDSIAAFAAQADKEVPAMRQKYGNDAPPAQYTIDINAKLVEGATTHSIIIDSYLYMGGANGNSIYKAFTADQAGKLVGIRDILTPEGQKAFVPFVQKELLAWSPDGTDQPTILQDEIKDLTLDSFSNFSFDDKDFTIYFDKYQIGPGALGAVAFPIPLAKMQAYLK